MAKYCQKCGRELEKIIHAEQCFSEYTGEQLYSVSFKCPLSNLFGMHTHIYVTEPFDGNIWAMPLKRAQEM
jgi:hypothetical protein